MKVVALVSGGKDSCYNILRCQEHGHELVALANLHPHEAAPDELDSFCFQTVGHQLLGLLPSVHWRATVSPAIPWQVSAAEADIRSNRGR